MGKIVPKKWVGSSDKKVLVAVKGRTPKDYEHVKRARRKAKTAHRKHGAPVAKCTRTVRQWVNRTPVAPRFAGGGGWRFRVDGAGDARRAGLCPGVAAGAAAGKRCDKCDVVEHATASCPHFTDGRTDHPDAKRKKLENMLGFEV
ncbi:hypothetical protein M885DRAFT_500311 [Pelagophyceae sp. CCMP2097]|nr:hypothetical protein M885DRAFT_500311 [Pelagophyceae sp. CCMP2097]